MKRLSTIGMGLGLILIFVLAGCAGGDEDSGEHGEESGTQFGRSEIFDEVRAGARLVLSFDSSADMFTGTVENVAGGGLSQVRVEVHLSNGVELGPTPRVDLAPGQIADVALPASGQIFETWSAHPEVGDDEHGDGSEEDSDEHDDESG